MSTPRPSSLVPELSNSLELAILASSFLPKIDLPDNWQTEHPHTLQAIIGKPTGTPFPENPGYRYPQGLRTAWEVICGEAVHRAKTLLDAALHQTRPEVTAWDQSKAQASEQMTRYEAKLEEISNRFDKIAGGREALPISEVLKVCLPRTESSACMEYWKMHLWEWQRDYNLRHKIPGEVVILDQAGRLVDREEFPRLIINFSAALETKGDSWRKALKRKEGKKAQRARRIKEEAEGYRALTDRSASKIDKANKRHQIARNRNK